MSNTKKLIIFTAIILLLSALGSCMLTGTARFAFSGFRGPKETSKTYDLKDSFNAISVETDTGNITILPAKDGKAKVVRTGSNINSFSLKTSRKHLTISDKDKRLWPFRIGTYAGKSEITIYLPKTTYQTLQVKSNTGTTDLRPGGSFENMDIKTDTGSVNISSVSVSDNLKVKTATGRITLTDVIAEDLSVKSNTGSITLQHALATDEMEIKSDTGSVNLERCDGPKIEIKTDTGSIKGTLLSGKTFDAKSDTGRVSIPASIPGGSCKIESDTGSITIEIEK